MYRNEKRQRLAGSRLCGCQDILSVECGWKRRLLDIRHLNVIRLVQS